MRTIYARLYELGINLGIAIPRSERNPKNAVDCRSNRICTSPRVMRFGPKTCVCGLRQGV